MATQDDIVDNVIQYFDADPQAAPEEAVINLAVQSAIDAINEVRCFEPTADCDVEGRYANLAARIAIHLCTKQGIEGVIGMSENGVSRSFETGDIPPSLIGQVTPVCRGW